MQAYSFTSKPIAAALDRAEARGVVVHVILDKSNLKETTYADAEVVRHGISVLVDAKHSIAHNKIIVIDGQVAITGSFNFTMQAENSNAENLLVIHDRALAAALPGQLARSRGPQRAVCRTGRSDGATDG